MTPSSPRSADFGTARRALPVIALCAAVVIGVLLFCYLIDVVLLAFAGVLLAILLRTPADWIAAKTRMHANLALALVVLAVAALLGFAFWLFGHSLREQFSTLFQRLPAMLTTVQEKLADYRWLIGDIDPAQMLRNQSPDVGSSIGRGVTAVVATFGVVGDFVIVFFTGLFLAINPGVYRRGVIQLVPLARRERVTEVLDALGDTLRRWLVGQIFLMVVIGTVAGLGLWLLKVPLAFALGFITGLLEFIPYIGPIVSAALVLLVAITESPQLALYVIGLYLVIHSLEGYVLTPLVQERAVYLPPATLLLAQVVLAVLVGLPGIMLATPIAATLLVVTRMLYVHDLLGQPLDSAT